MKAVVMAGGEGTRLRPLTSLRPKPMVPIANQPVMEHILALVKHHGIEEAVATLAFMPKAIQDYFRDGEEWGMKISYAIEETPLGTAGSVKNAQSLLDDDEPFLVISGDALTDIDLTEVIEFHRTKGAAVTIALKRMPDPLEFGVVITDDDGRIQRFLEKPSWGQVFSDTVNTGIYVIEPWVLSTIPEGQSYDFSSDVFPALLDQGHPLYGFVADGYWCDVGSRESYVEAQSDILEGKAKLYIPGVSAREGLWIGDSARIEDGVELGRGVVIGKNTHIRSGARIGDGTVIGDNCVVGNEAYVSHSVLWNDVYVGQGAVVSGAVLCRRVDVRSNAKIDQGAVIGDETTIGRGAHVGAGVQVFPYKRVEPAALLNRSLIWEATGVASLFGETGIAGLAGVDVTPEVALKAAQAFGTTLPVGGHVVVTRDTSRAARMIKRAVIAGLNSATMYVRDLRVASPALNRFTTRDTRCIAGVHVCAGRTDAGSVEIHFFDADGLDIPASSEKKVERLYFREEFRRAFFEEIGDIIYPPRALDYYARGLTEAIVADDSDTEWRKLVADFQGGLGGIVAPQVAQGWRINLIGLNTLGDSEVAQQPPGSEPEARDDLYRAVELFAADLGVRFDSAAERIDLVTPKGLVLDGDTALHAVVDLWCRTDGEGRGIAVPLQASTVIERIAEKSKRTVVRPGRSRRALARAVHDGHAGFAGSKTGGYIFGNFLAAYDAVLSAGMITRMLGRVGASLDDIVSELPEFFLQEVQVFCPADRKGAVMREVTEAAAGLQADFTEGVRVSESGGWALVLPHGSEPVVHIYAEGSDADHAESLAKRWTQLVESVVAAE